MKKKHVSQKDLEKSKKKVLKDIATEDSSSKKQTKINKSETIQTTKSKPARKVTKKSAKKVVKNSGLSSDITNDQAIAALIKEETEAEQNEQAQLTGFAGWKAKRKVKQAEKKAKHKLRPLKIRILLQVAKTLYKRIPITIVIVLAIVLVFLKLYLTAERVEKLIITNFNATSNGTISLKVKEFSPYSGFVMDNILIKNGKEFNESTFVEMQRLAIRYGLFQMLIGNIRFPEIGIYKPRIYIQQKNGIWNVAKLMKPGEKKPEKKKPEEKKQEKKETKDDGSKEINLPISVEFLFKFILDDLRLYVNADSFSSKVEGLTFSVDIDVPPFKKIPKSIEAVSILKKMNIVLNPKEQMDISFLSKDADVVPPLILTWKLIFEKPEAGKAKFNSMFKFGTYRMPVRFKSVHLAPLNFMVSYDMYYNPHEDHLKLNHLGITFKNQKWIWLVGDISHVTKNQNLDLKMAESLIPLQDLYPYFLSFTRMYSTQFGGAISLYPLTIKGNPSSIDISGAVNIRGLFFNQPGTEASIPWFSFSYFIAKRMDNMKILANLSLPHIFYKLKGRMSGDNGFEFKADISAFNNFASVALHNIGIRLYNPVMRKDALSIGINGNVALKPSLSGKVNIYHLRFQKDPLIDMVPINFRQQIAGIPLNKPLDISLSASFGLAQNIAATVGISIKVPDFNLNDLRLDTNIFLNNTNGTFYLNSFYLGSKAWNLAVTANGNVKLKPEPMADSDLRLQVKLHNPELKTMHGPWKLKGLLEVNARMLGSLKTGKAFGSINIDKFFVKNDLPESLVSLENLNLHFPFEYKFKTNYTGESKITITKNQIIDNEKFNDKPNFTITSIKAKHPARQMQYEYIKDFSAAMSFKENVFQINNLKAYVIDGSLYGRRIIFNLADLKPENMEFMLILDVTNVDIGRLDDPDPKTKTRDAEISLNANFSGKGVNIQKELTARGYINLYKVGEKFANRLMKGLSQEQGKSKLGIGQGIVDRFMSIKGFNFDLDKGLMNVTVSLKRGLVGYAIGVAEKINFDRVPIQEYLRKF